MAVALVLSCAHTRVAPGCYVEQVTVLRQATVTCTREVATVEHEGISVTFGNLISAALGAVAAWVGGL